MKLLYELDMQRTSDMVNNKVILITGGTGSFGNKLVETLLKDFSPKKIIIFSRDEFKQYNMNSLYFIDDYGKTLFLDTDYISHYASLGADFIGVHRRTFENIEDMEIAIKKIISLKRKPGIFLEINEDFDYEITSIITKYNIKWIVPVGYGGQFFNKTIIPKIKKTQLFFRKKNVDCKIEIDGGLTIEVIDEIKNLGIDYYAGWSIVKGNNIREVSEKIDILKKTLR